MILRSAKSRICSAGQAVCGERHHYVSSAAYAVYVAYGQCRFAGKDEKGVILINTARGELFDTEALIEGVENLKIGALAMDVFEGEDGIYHVDRTDDILRNRNMAYLRQFPNVVLTQHMAFYTQLSMDSMIENSVEGLIGFNRAGKTRFEIEL